MNRKLRSEVVKAMELLARQINDEDIFYSWITCGVADGDIDPDEPDEDVSWYYEDDGQFADLMDTFLYCMSKAYKSGGLYCDKVVSKPED